MLGKWKELNNMCCVLPEERAFQAEGTANAKRLRLEQVHYIGGMPRQPECDQSGLKGSRVEKGRKVRRSQTV